MIDIHTVKNRPKDGKNIIAFICDDEEYSLLMSEITFKYECTIRPSKNGKPVTVAAVTGIDSSVVSPLSDNNKEESASDSTLSVSQQAIAELKRLATDSERGKAIRRLINGEVVTSQDYPHITTLGGKLGNLLGRGVVGKTKVARRRKNGRVKNYIGYFFRVIPTIQ